MFFETKYGKIHTTLTSLRLRLGMFFETKYGKMETLLLRHVLGLGMFFETKYGKMQEPYFVHHHLVRDVL